VGWVRLATWQGGIYQHLVVVEDIGKIMRTIRAFCLKTKESTIMRAPMLPSPHLFEGYNFCCLSLNIVAFPRAEQSVSIASYKNH